MLPLRTNIGIQEHNKISISMKRITYILLLLACSLNNSVAWRPTLEMTAPAEKVTEAVAKELPSCPRGVSINVSLNSGAGIGIAISKSARGTYRLLFIIARHCKLETPAQSMKNDPLEDPDETDQTMGFRTISFQPIPNAAFAWRLRHDVELKLSFALCHTAGLYTVENEIEYQGKIDNVLFSTKTVKCEVISEKEVVRLLEVYLSSFPKGVQFEITR